MASSYFLYAASSSRHRMAVPSNSPATRRNRVERSHKRPIIVSTPTPDRKRSSTDKNAASESKTDVTDLSSLPILALTQVFFYLPSEDRLVLSQTCRKLHQAEMYFRRHRCRLNVRLDLLCSYEGSLRQPNLTTPMDDFGSTELFCGLLQRSLSNQPGSVCAIDKIAAIDFSPPQDADGVVSRKYWGGRTFITETTLRNFLGENVVPSMVELYLHHCYVSFGALDAVARVFVRLEKLSVSLKGLEFPTSTMCNPTLDGLLARSISNWSRLMPKTKQNPLMSSYVKAMVLFVYNRFSVLETLVIYKE